MIVDIGKIKDKQELAQQLRYISSLDSLVESAKDDNEIKEDSHDRQHSSN